MEKKISVCEICGKKADDERYKRKENWLRMQGGGLHGISVWLEKPRSRKKGVCDAFMLHVGYQDREYDFCSIECLCKALRGNESI